MRSPTRFVLPSFLLTACAAPAPRVDAEAAVGRALALPSAVDFRVEGGPIDAAEPAALALSHEDALRRAVERSPELQAALARVRAAQAEADLARLLPNPVLSLVLRVPEGGGRAEVEAGLAADLLAVLQRPRRASAAGHRLEAEAAAALSTALDVVLAVEEAYARAQALEVLVPLDHERIAVLERLGAVAEARLEAGAGTRGEASALEAERLELALEAAQRKAELAAARLALARLVGEPSGEAAWRLDPLAPPEGAAAPEPAWIDAALRARPEVLAARWELLARGDEAALAGSDGLDGASVGAEAERADGWALGPAAALPLPLAGGADARGRLAASREAEAGHRLVAAQRAVVHDVRAALAALADARASLDRVVLELAPLQERRRAEVELAFEVGEADVTLVLEAERALQRTRALAVALGRDAALARARLERAAGGRGVVAASLAEAGR